MTTSERGCAMTGEGKYESHVMRANRERSERALGKQTCRDCGNLFPYDADADRCAACCAVMVGAEPGRRFEFSAYVTVYAKDEGEARRIAESLAGLNLGTLGASLSLEESGPTELEEDE